MHLRHQLMLQQDLRKLIIKFQITVIKTGENIQAIIPSFDKVLKLAYA